MDYCQATADFILSLNYDTELVFMSNWQLCPNLGTAVSIMDYCQAIADFILLQNYKI